MRLVLVVLLFSTSSIYAEPNLRGWDRLVQRLIDDGADRDQVISAYSSSRMPKYELVAYQLAPKESARIYTWFFKSKNISYAKQKRDYFHAWFDLAEKRFDVSKNVIAGILLIETQFGRITGKSMVLNRLSRLANIGQADNLDFNYRRHKSRNKHTTRAEVEDRARYLEELFFPEVRALFKIAKDRDLNIFNIVGSRAGAIGIPQFLPNSMLRFGIDANGNGQVSLFEMPDAILSVANFLKQHGWDSKSKKKQYDAIFGYNRSDAYVNAVLTVASKLD